jgi:hypothetical protein
VTDMAVRPTLSAPGGWDRYYQVQADLDPLLGTPGIGSAFGATVEAEHGSFRQITQGGFFLQAPEPAPDDPAALSAALSGAPTSGALVSVVGTRRTRARRNATGTHSQFEQIVRGARLVGGDLRIHQDAEGVFAVTGRPLGDLAARDPGEAPELESREALQTCAERFELDELREARVEQVVFPQAEGAVWAYEVAFVVPEHAADVRVYLHADDMRLLLSYNISSAAHGRGKVYEINPMQTPTLIDVTLDGLEVPGNLLRGPSLDVTQAAGTRMDRPDSDFDANPNDDEFDEPQVYHHVRRAAEYFRNITSAGLMDAAPFTPMRVLVNDPGSPNNAYYSPSTGELRFGLFGNRSSARSASIVIHEFGHAISDGICQLGRSVVRNTQARGLSEGFSDYFAASLLDDPRLGDYVADDAGGARNCADRLKFPSGFVGEEHSTGAVWASVLWAIRGEVRQALCDSLAVESLDFLDNTSTFENARTALHSVDARLYGDANKDVIDREFDSRVS